MMNTFKLFVISCLLICFIGSCGDKEVDEASGTILALSYNVAGLPDIVSSSKPSLYTSHISPLLNRFDIVHVQENFCFHDSLILYNNHSSVTDPMPCVPDGDGLNTFTNYSIELFERITWEDCFGFDCLTPKGFSFSRIELHKGISVDFYNIHCNAGGSEEDKTARRANIQQFLNYVKVHSLNKPIVVMGDFNCRYTREGDTIRALIDWGFKDAWVDLILNDEFPICGISSLKDCEPIGTSSTCEGVDKLFYKSSDEFKIEAVRFQYGDNPKFLYKGIDSLPLSDHLPLEVELVYKFKRK